MSDVVENQSTMRILGAVIFAFSAIQIGVGAAAYVMFSWNVGCWWAGVLCFATSICALISTDRRAVITGCTFSVFSLILVFAGLGLDGAFYGVTNGLDSCINQKTGEYYGEEGLFSIYAECTGHSETCLCVNEQTSDKCYVFNIKEADNCGQILTRLPSLLMASVIFLTFLFVLVLAYSIFTCKMLCCKPALADDQAAVGASGADANATLTRV